MAKKQIKKQKRERWSSRLIFLFAAIGSAVGLGNVWRFPYLAGKYGGGAFLIPYLIMLFVLGVPLLILEFGLGQKMQRAAVGSFGRIRKYLAPIGYSAIFFGFIICSYYAVVMAWSLIYFFNSFAVNWADGPKEYFFTSVLQASSGIGDIGGINWIVLSALIAIWVMIYFCVFKGTKSVGKVVLITMPLPVILILVLVARGVTLPNAMNGLLFYLKPNFAALWDVEVWTAAISQMFFTLSLAFGIMIAYASYNEKLDVTKNAWITAITNSLISIVAGFAVFGTLGFMASQQSVPVADVAAAGPSLAFIAYPQALSMMPLAALFSIIFFITLLSLAIDSAFSLVEAVLAAVSDRWAKIPKQRLAFIICTLGFLAGIIYTTNAGIYFLDIVDHFVTNYGLVLVGIAECLAIGWIYGIRKLTRYINSVSDWRVGKYWELFIKFIIPILLVLFIVTQFMTELKENYGGYPDWAIMMGWGFVVVPIILSILLSLVGNKRY